MITKRQFAELVIRNLSGGAISNRNKFDEREVFKYADMAISAMIAEEHKIKRSQASAYINGNYVTAFEVKVKYDLSRKECYMDLPAEMISLANDNGLRMVSPIHDQESPYMIIANGMQSVFSKLEAGLNDPYIFDVYVQGGQIRIPRMSNFQKPKKLLVKMICSTSGLKPNDPLPIPANSEWELVTEVVKLYRNQGITPNKQSNDGNPNTH